jgi:hypothetical protein
MAFRSNARLEVRCHNVSRMCRYRDDLSCGYGFDRRTKRFGGEEFTPQEPREGNYPPCGSKENHWCQRKNLEKRITNLFF